MRSTQEEERPHGLLVRVRVDDGDGYEYPSAKPDGKYLSYKLAEGGHGCLGSAKNQDASLLTYKYYLYE
jgi:hypothetical protein